MQLGYGRKLRRIWTAETDRTSAIAEGISRDKDLTKRLLAGCGVPVPEGREVSDADDAWAAASAETVSSEACTLVGPAPSPEIESLAPVKAP